MNYKHIIVCPREFSQQCDPCPDRKTCERFVMERQGLDVINLDIIELDTIQLDRRDQ